MKKKSVWFFVILCCLLVLALMLPGPAPSEKAAQGTWEIRFNTRSLEHILLNPENILADPETFWQTDRAYILADRWHRSKGIDKNTRNYYSGWLDFLKKLAQIPPGERKNHRAFTFLEILRKKKSVFFDRSVPHVKNLFPKNKMSLETTIYITAGTLPYAFAAGGSIVMDVLNPGYKMDADAVWNMITHEVFHIGYRHSRRLRKERPLKNEFIYHHLLDNLQNEGMAVYAAYTARRFFPNPGEKDYVLLENIEEIQKRLGWMNDIFDAAHRKTLPEKVLREKAWDLGVMQRGYYVLGAFMAQKIDEKLGRRALVQTVAEGPLSFIRTYNRVADQKMTVFRFTKLK